MTRRWAVIGVVGAICAAVHGPRPHAQAPSGAPLPDGTPVQAEQFPRFLRPTHADLFGFDNLLVLGDHPEVVVEYPDGTDPETWPRLGTAALAGRTVSVFRLAWDAARLADGLRGKRWGVDRPVVEWGRLVVPTASSASFPLCLQLAPPGLPAAPVERIGDAVQYSSHVVNLWIPGFGESRLTGGDAALDLAAVTQRFYDHFADRYDTIAIVSQTTLLMDAIGRHRLVRNAIDGIGLELFDESAAYGSRGVLQGVEVFPPGDWATARAVLHQQAHQWGEYSRVWQDLGIARAGDDPARHMPLLTPDPTQIGAVLEATREVASTGGGQYVIERPAVGTRFHPLTLYRMGLLDAADLPALAVFVDQGQFDPEGRSLPSAGTAVGGDTVALHPTDLVAADGTRRGPVVDRVRRALVYVTRSGLASQDEMDALNYFARRFEATSGVTSWDQYPSFAEATGGRATMTTAIEPVARPALGPTQTGGLSVTDPDVPVDALTGIQLDAPVPGRIAPGDTVSVSGAIVDAEPDVAIICFRFIRYGAADANEVFICSSVTGGRFELSLAFLPSQRGTYTIEPFFVASPSGTQTARERYGVITVE